MPLAVAQHPKRFEGLSGVRSRSSAPMNLPEGRSSCAPRSGGLHAARRILPSASQGPLRSGRAAGARAIEVLPEKVDNAIQACGLPNECLSFEVPDMRSRSVLFHSQDSKQILFVFSELPGYLIVGGSAWKVPLKAKENSVCEYPRPVDRHLALSPFCNRCHGHHGFQIQCRELGRDEGGEQSYERN